VTDWDAPILAGSQGIGPTWMNIPYLVGTIFTPNRDPAKFIGFFLHFANGWIFLVHLRRRVSGVASIDLVDWRWYRTHPRRVCADDGDADFACIASANGQRTIRTNCCAPTRAARFPWSALWYSHADFDSLRTRHFWRDPGRILGRQIIAVGIIISARIGAVLPRNFTSTIVK